MRLIFKEHKGILYQKYEFPYCVYAIKESMDSYADLYSKGFLPYSNDFDIQDEIYYLARSIRIDLQCEPLFCFKQKNIFNKFQKVFPFSEIAIQLIDKNLIVEDPEFINWCIIHAKDHFLSEDRLRYILSRPYLKQIMQIKHKDCVLAYLFPIIEAKTLFHIWFSFYDNTISLNDFGKWIILQTIKYAQEHGFKEYYIGTCYGITAFYKLTLSPKTFYFNGEYWDQRVSELRNKIREE
jgi:leucyl-tRNA---protein transferase